MMYLSDVKFVRELHDVHMSLWLTCKLIAEGDVLSVLMNTLFEESAGNGIRSYPATMVSQSVQEKTL